METTFHETPEQYIVINKMQIKVCDDDSGGGSMGGERKTYLRKVST